MTPQRTFTQIPTRSQYPTTSLYKHVASSSLACRSHSHTNLTNPASCHLPHLLLSSKRNVSSLPCQLFTMKHTPSPLSSCIKAHHYEPKSSNTKQIRTHFHHLTTTATLFNGHQRNLQLVSSPENVRHVTLYQLKGTQTHG